MEQKEMRRIIEIILKEKYKHIIKSLIGIKKGIDN